MCKFSLILYHFTFVSINAKQITMNVQTQYHHPSENTYKEMAWYMITNLQDTLSLKLTNQGLIRLKSNLLKC